MRRSWRSLLGVVGDNGLELPFDLVAKNDCSQPSPDEVDGSCSTGIERTKVLLSSTARKSQPPFEPVRGRIEPLQPDRRRDVGQLIDPHGNDPNHPWSRAVAGIGQQKTRHSKTASENRYLVMSFNQSRKTARRRNPDVRVR